ncbi:hypothetical protein AN958_07522 [Leucoagaricus sp. SymC.cos]|nr:hypothetical protein AN958_07522 [Leucoagaricus sp. SymC.cos]
MSWRKQFEEGVALFKVSKYTEALEKFDGAIVNGGENQFILYDTRAAVYEALKNPKDALKDAKTTIKLAPQQWRGYARAARLFMKTHKFDASLRMADLAVSHVKSEDGKRREELIKLKAEISECREAIAARERRMQNHMLKLPIEIYNEIFQIALADDYAQIITLLHVCMHWRQVVWDSPGLWHTLVLSKSHADKKAALWIERSNGRIRELHVLNDYHTNQLLGRPTFFDKLDWLYLRVCRIHHPRILDSIEPATMLQHIEELEIDALHAREIAPSFFHPCEGIKSLSLSKAELHLEHLRSFSSLNSLHLNAISLPFSKPSDFLEILRSNPQIESLHLNLVKFANSEPVAHTLADIENPPKLNSLSTLEVQRGSWFSTILLLDIPSLRYLRFDSLTVPSDFNRHIHYWASTSPKFLTELSLKYIVLVPPVILKLLAAAPSLEYLSLVGVLSTTSQVVLALSQSDLPCSEESNTPCLCPRLRYLDISETPDVATSLVQDLVKQRLVLSASTSGEGREGETMEQPVHVSKLEVLKMDGCPMIDVQWLPWFREHVLYVSCVYATASKKNQRGIARRVALYPIAIKSHLVLAIHDTIQAVNRGVRRTEMKLE